MIIIIILSEKLRFLESLLMWSFYSGCTGLSDDASPKLVGIGICGLCSTGT